MFFIRETQVAISGESVVTFEDDNMKIMIINKHLLFSTYMECFYTMHLNSSVQRRASEKPNMKNTYSFFILG